MGLFPVNSTRPAKPRLSEDSRNLILEKSMGFRKPYISGSGPSRLKGTKITCHRAGALQTHLYMLQNTRARLGKANSA